MRVVMYDRSMEEFHSFCRQTNSSPSSSSPPLIHHRRRLLVFPIRSNKTQFAPSASQSHLDRCWGSPIFAQPSASSRVVIDNCTREVSVGVVWPWLHSTNVRPRSNARLPHNYRFILPLSSTLELDVFLNVSTVFLATPHVIFLPLFAASSRPCGSVTSLVKKQTFVKIH